MRKMIAAMKVSVDMKYQGPGGYADWVNGWSEDYGLMPQIDLCLLGGQMYRGYEQYWSAMRRDPLAPSAMTGAVPTAAELLWSEQIPALPHYVLSGSLTDSAWPNTRFLRSLDDAAALKTQPGKDIYLMGGGQTVRTFMEAGLLDELRLIVYPVIAGGPHALFGSQDMRRLTELVSVRDLPGGLVASTYRILSSEPTENDAAA